VLTNGMATLSWSAVAGHTYRLQFKNNLTDPAWTDALPDVTANSATASASDNVGLIANRFYRVMLVQ